jgi:RHS repeat-associated protein
LVKIETGAGSPVPIGDYAYDGLHRRISRTMYVSGSIDFSRRMYYSQQWQVLEERQYEDPNWLPNKQYVWGIRYIDELILRDQDTSSPLNGTLNTRHYALQDANFNVVAIVGSTGSVVRRYSYDAYGHSITLEADFTPGAYEYDFEYRYAGYRWDYETQLLQVRNRWYHPRLGRWVSRDPIGYDGGSMNLYAYVGGNPIKDVDPYGNVEYQIKPDKVPNMGWYKSKLNKGERGRTIVIGLASPWKAKNTDCGGKVTFTVKGEIRILLDLKQLRTIPKRERTYGHEQVHVKNIVTIIKRESEKILKPVEEKTFATKEDATAAAEKAVKEFSDAINEAIAKEAKHDQKANPTPPISGTLVKPMGEWPRRPAGEMEAP